MSGEVENLRSGTYLIFIAHITGHYTGLKIWF